MALLRPLAPGEGTWPELLNAAEKQRAAEASAEAALAAVTQVSMLVESGLALCQGSP